MSLKPISTIVFEIQNQPGWEGVRDWGLILRAWVNTVSPTIANYTQPRSISREILTVATNSSSLAHQLTFGRQALCKKLNAQLSSPIRDLRFVAAGYQPNHRNPTAIDNSDIPINSGAIVICAHCNSRARAGEIRRWSVCQFCAIELEIIGKSS